MAFYQKQQMDQALADFTRATELDPKNAEAWYWRGSAQGGRSEEAVESFSRALEINPGDARSWHGRGVSYLLLKQWDKAIADESRAIELAPKAAAYRHFRGNAYAAKEEWDKALADYSAALENREDGNHVPVWEKRADLYVRRGEWAKAKSDYEEAVKWFFRNPPTRNSLAWLLATCPEAGVRDPARAVEVARETAELGPKWGPAWNTLGVAQYRAGDWKAALAALNKVEQNPGDLRNGAPGSTWFFLAMTHQQLGNKDEARKWYDKAVEWTEKNQPKDEELGRFHAEAAEVLGLEKPPKKEPAPK
jgi:tetratricopeptide (TPR) repeat protein